MNYKCTTKKDGFKNLTVNKNYDGVEQGDNILITADNGTPQKYNKKYFQRLPRTLAEMFDQFLSLRFIRDGEALNISWAGAERAIAELSIGRSRVSCGLTEMWNISSLRTLIDTIIREYNLDEISKNDVSIDLWGRILSHLRRNQTGIVFLMCSDVVTDEIEDYVDGLDAAAVNITNGLNNNSDNQIRIWTIRVHE